MKKAHSMNAPFLFFNPIMLRGLLPEDIPMRKNRNQYICQDQLNKYRLQKLHPEDIR